jgi:fatty-acyl-CoA synthase
MNRPLPAHWPAGLPYTLTPPEGNLGMNLTVSALRYPEKAALIFFGHVISYREMSAQVDALAAYLTTVSGVRRGDRVLLMMQNSPQFVIAYYAILRADAVVVPANVMLLSEELRQIVDDSGARVAITAQDLLSPIQTMVDEGTLQRAVVACLGDYAGNDQAQAPAFVTAARQSLRHSSLVSWHDALAAGLTTGPAESGSDDLACLPYTSGTTGQAKGCMHTHRSVMFAAVAGALWSGAAPDHVGLVTLPMFHVTGMQVSMNAAIYLGATMVIMPRWDRELAGQLIARYRVTTWTSIPTMMIDFLSNPTLDAHDLSSLRRVSGGGAAMPAAIAEKLLNRTGLRYTEGYGLSETIGTTHANPPQRLKQSCLGLPIFNVDARVIDPDSHRELNTGEVGEIIIHGPQVFQGYWRDDAKTRAAFIDIDGKRFLRTGDLGHVDKEGFFFFTDRLKRMINASGYKVWPAEIEAMMVRHPEIRDCCIIAASDSYRGETVKAVVVRKEGSKLLADELMAWAQTQMAAYKVPRMVQFVDKLPKSATGKVMWRQLQDAEFKSTKLN